MLITAAMIWGLSFVAQSQGMEYVGGFTFNGIRMLIGSFVLMPIILVGAKKNPQKSFKALSKKDKKTTVVGILVVGGILCVGSNLQQFAFNYTEVGKVGFITALYMLLVPLIGLFMKKRPPLTVWVGIVMGLCGLYLICVGGSGINGVGKGEILAFLCSFAFAFHIVAIDHFADKIDGVVLSCGQFFVTGVLSCICMFIFENPDMGNILACWLPILYAGILSCGVAYTLQIVAQADADPTAASLILCLESVFAVISGAVLLHESMSPRELMGCVVIFAAVIISNLPEKTVKLADK